MGYINETQLRNRMHNSRIELIDAEQVPDGLPAFRLAPAILRKLGDELADDRRDIGAHPALGIPPRD